MCNQLVTLAFEAAPVLNDTNGSGPRPAGSESPLASSIRRYIEAARRDAGKASVDRRGAFDRLLVAEQMRLAARQGNDAAAVGRSESAVVAARRSSTDATRREAQAQSDCAFAAARAARPESAIGRGPHLTGQALRTFAIERIRQIEEIAAAWGTDRPSRDRVLLDDLRGRFQALSLAQAP